MNSIKPQKETEKCRKMQYKVPYDFDLFYELGGSDPPYVDFATDHRGRTSCRIFICSDCLEWEEFQKQALIAAKAHQMRKNPMYEGELINKSSAPIANDPHYLLDERTDCFAVYVNIQCPDKEEYERAKIIAASKIAEIEKAKELFGSPLWRTQVSAEYTRYPAEQNETDPIESVIFKKYGIR